jgi:hypothetical protein
MQIYGSAASQAVDLFTQVYGVMRFWSDWTLDGTLKKQVGYEAGSMDKVDNLAEHMTFKTPCYGLTYFTITTQGPVMSVFRHVTLYMNSYNLVVTKGVTVQIHVSTRKPQPQ